MFKNMSIAKKMALGFGLVLVLTIGAGVYEIVSYLKMAHTYAEYAPTRLGQIHLVGDTSLAFKKQVQEWKDILLRGYNPEDFKKHTEGFHKWQEQVRKDIEGLKSGPYRLVSEENKKNLEEFIKKYDVLQGEYTEALKLYTAGAGGNFKEADAYVKGKDRGATDILDEIIDVAEKHTHQKVDQLKAQAMSIGTIIGIILLFSLLGGIIIAVIITRNISRPILAAAEKLSASSQQLSSSAQEMNATAEEVSSTVQQIAKGSETTA